MVGLSFALRCYCGPGAKGTIGKRKASAEGVNGIKPGRERSGGPGCSIKKRLSDAVIRQIIARMSVFRRSNGNSCSVTKLISANATFGIRVAARNDSYAPTALDRFSFIT
jgi:hypothetical protein